MIRLGSAGRASHAGGIQGSESKQSQAERVKKSKQDTSPRVGRLRGDQHLRLSRLFACFPPIPERSPLVRLGKHPWADLIVLAVSQITH